MAADVPRLKHGSRVAPERGVRHSAAVLHYDASVARCTVLTWREGLLSAVGHDLVLAVTRFEIEVDDVARRVEARFDAGSLHVVSARRDGHELPGALGGSERRQIDEAVARDVLDADRHPEIRFASTAVDDDGPGFRARGALALHGVERPLVIPVRREGACWVAEARLHQPDYGIVPYRALLGALRVRADVLVRVELPAPSG
jgi:polyisoprenoid-binding protein YceI